MADALERLARSVGISRRLTRAGSSRDELGADADAGGLGARPVEPGRWRRAELGVASCAGQAEAGDVMARNEYSPRASTTKDARQLTWRRSPTTTAPLWVVSLR